MLTSLVNFQLILAYCIDYLCIALTQYLTEQFEGRRAYSGSQFQRDFRQSWQGRQRRLPLSAVLEWDTGSHGSQPGSKEHRTEPGLSPATFFNKKIWFKVYNEHNFIIKKNPVSMVFLKEPRAQVYTCPRHLIHMDIKCIKRHQNSVSEMEIQTTVRSLHA